MRLANRLYVCGWLLLAVSFALPAVYIEWRSISERPETYAGWEAALWSFQTGPENIRFWCGLTNLIFIFTAFARKKPGWRLPLAIAMTLCTLINLFPAFFALHVRAGYWCWLGAFILN